MEGRPPGLRLTPREREIADLFGLGFTNKEIATQLKISDRTAGAHVQNMLTKLGASNRAQIVALWVAPPVIQSERLEGSGPGSPADFAMSLLVFNGDATAFGGKTASVQFKDFHLQADRVVCS